MKTSIDCLQWGQVTRSVFEGDTRSSPSHVLHLKWMLRAMKSLAVILLLTVPLQAQTLADAARKERARQAQLRSLHVYQGKGTRTETTTPPAATAVPAAPAATAPAPAAPKPEPPKPAAPPAPSPTPNPAAQRNAEIAKLQAKMLELENQERALQLQVNQLTNQLLAPISDQNANNEAQAQIGVAQSKLTAVRTELDLTKKTLGEMQSQGTVKQ
jgi:type IV secretory pathway VirB10-like protein